MTNSKSYVTLTPVVSGVAAVVEPSGVWLANSKSSVVIAPVVSGVAVVDPITNHFSA